jgi:hypothetical protein
MVSLSWQEYSGVADPRLQTASFHGSQHNERRVKSAPLKVPACRKHLPDKEMCLSQDAVRKRLPPRIASLQNKKSHACDSIPADGTSTVHCVTDELHRRVSQRRLSPSCRSNLPTLLLTSAQALKAVLICAVRVKNFPKFLKSLHLQLANALLGDAKI